jgi:hypothetical protein
MSRNPYQPPGALDWHRCYTGDTSRDDLLFKKASVAHPAKGSLPLFNRILDTMIEFGWLENGACVVDPFGGRGTTALLWACRHPENRAVTVEIEPHFVQMQHENKAYAEKRLGRALRWEIIQGDSRNCDSLLAEAGCCAVGSPPYRTTGGDSPACRGEGRRPGKGPGVFRREIYGSHPGNLGNLPDKDDPPEAAPAPVMIASPPYGQGVIGKANPKQAERLRALTQDPNSSLHGRDPNGRWFQAMEQGYINSPGNIDLCPDEAPVSALGSPPYEASLASDDPEKRGGFLKSDPKRRNDRTMNAGYAPPAAISSPPYETSINADQHGIDWTKAGPATGNRKRGEGCKHEETFRAQLNYRAPEAAIGSQPFESQSGGHPLPTSGPLADPALHARHAASKINPQAGYGAGAALGSPPYADSVHGRQDDATSNGIGRTDGRVHGRERTATGDYGSAPSQIGAMQSESYAGACLQVYQALARAGVRFVCLVTKNPTRRLTGVKWCACFHEREWSLRRLNRLAAKLHRYPLPVALWLVVMFAAWVETLDEGGWPETDTARHQTVILGGNRYLCCGDCGKPIPRAGGELRRLDKLTARLLRQAGYRVVAWRRAVLFEEETDRHERLGQGSLFGDEVPRSGKKTGRLSFFRRLSLSKGGVAASHEDCFFAELVTAGGEGCAAVSSPDSDDADLIELEYEKHTVTSGRGSVPDVSGGPEFRRDSRRIRSSAEHGAERLEADEHTEANTIRSPETVIREGQADSIRTLGGEEAFTEARRKDQKRASERRESLGLEGREGVSRLSQAGSEREVRAVRLDREAVHPSSGHGSLQPHDGEPGSPLHLLSSLDAQESVLGGISRGQGTPEEQRAGGLEARELQAQSQCLIVISSPPYADVEVMTPKGAIGAAWQQGKHARDTFAQEDKGARRYGRTVGQIGALPDTDPPAVVIASPPYGGKCAPGRRGNNAREAALPAADRMGASCHGAGYGNTPGQIEGLPDTPTEPDR